MNEYENKLFSLFFLMNNYLIYFIRSPDRTKHRTKLFTICIFCPSFREFSTIIHFYISTGKFVNHQNRLTESNHLQKQHFHQTSWKSDKDAPCKVSTRVQNGVKKDTSGVMFTLYRKFGRVHSSVSLPVGYVCVG